MQKPTSTMTPEQFRTWREQHDLTQAQAAERLGVSKRSIFAYENAGPVPKSIELACRQIATELETLDATRLVREQYPRLGSNFLVMPYQIERTSSYAHVLETSLTSDVKDWLLEYAPGADLTLKTVITPTKKRIQVPVISFESEADAFYFKLRWC